VTNVSHHSMGITVCSASNYGGGLRTPPLCLVKVRLRKWVPWIGSYE